MIDKKTPFGQVVNRTKAKLGKGETVANGSAAESVPEPITLFLDFLAFRIRHGLCVTQGAGIALEIDSTNQDL